MSTGALIFAYNNESIDYVSLAAWSANNLRRHLGLKVCLVTDSDQVPDHFDIVKKVPRRDTQSQRQFDDLGKSVTWYNHDRTTACDISPWQNTLLLDADYVVASDQLRILMETDKDFLCHRWARDISGRSSLEDLNYFGRQKMPMWWATVIFFRKTLLSQQIFGIMDMVRNNWAHYQGLYGIPRSPYRNDYALSIALNITSGHTMAADSIPWNLQSVMPDTKISSTGKDRFKFQWNDTNGKPRWSELRGQDFHAMGKKYLGDMIENNR